MIQKSRTSENKPFKMSNHGIGQEKYAPFLVHCRIKISLAHKALIAIRARDWRNIFFIKEYVQVTASATITIDHSRGETSFLGAFNICLYAENNFSHVFMPSR